MLESHKRISAVSVALAALFLAASPLATKAARSENAPEYNGVFKERNPITGAYKNLERVSPVTTQETHLLSASAYMVLSGSRSNVRFRVGEPVEFVIRVTSADDESMSRLQFYNLESESSSRVLPLGKLGIISLKIKSTRDEHAVPFSVARLGEHLLVFTPLQALPSGEYFLSLPSIHDGFCFGVE